MGYLKMTFDNYYYSTEYKKKVKIISDFRNIIWNTLPYIKIEKRFRYKVEENLVENEFFDLLKQYSDIPYMVLKSRYNINELDKVDLVKARINSNYGKYFDKEVYLDKKYYKKLANFKNIYFKYIKGEKENIEEKITLNLDEVNRLRIESLERKIELNWDSYKGFIDSCFDKIFENYKPIEEKINNGQFIPNHIMDWDEDNYVLCYINKSLNGYLKNYVKEIKSGKAEDKYKNCKICGKRVELKEKAYSKKYCVECWKEIRRQNRIEYNKKYYIKNKA